MEAFLQGLRDRGYDDGKNMVLEYREAAGHMENVPRLAAELVRLDVDVIVTAGPSATAAAKNATNSIPIVMAWDDDPVGNGFVRSRARPGGNITGSHQFRRRSAVSDWSFSGKSFQNFYASRLLAT